MIRKIKFSSRKQKCPLFFTISGLLFFGVSSALFVGCSAAPPTPPPVPPVPPKVEEFIPPPKVEIPRYSYAGDGYPDPFIPLSASGRASAPDELVIPNINLLSLKGIYMAGKDKIALFSGGGYSYTARNGYLYDARNRIMPGYRVTIGVESARVSVGGISREIKLRE